MTTLMKQGGIFLCGEAPALRLCMRMEARRRKRRRKQLRLSEDEIKNGEVRVSRIRKSLRGQ